MKISLAIQITILRIILAPFVVYAIVQQMWGLALLLFMTAMGTDFLDGFVARRYKQESRFGQLLDPVADKILIVGSLYSLLLTNMDPIMHYAGWFFISKEIIILIGATYLYQKYRIFIKPTFLSRFASVGEMGIVVVLLCQQYMNYPLGLFLHGMVLSNCLVSIVLLIKYGMYVMTSEKQSL